MKEGLTKRSSRSASLILFGTLLLCGGPALAQSYPERPIRIIVPSTAGGALDTGARLIAPKMSDALSQPVIVDNRPGAGGHIAQDMVAKAQPDGYTILFDAPNLAIGPALYRNLPFNPVKDFIPVTQLVATQLILVTSTKSQISSVKELVARAKSKPGSLNYGHMGVGSTLHLMMELLKISTGSDIVGVPYKGDALIGAALMSGEVQAAIVPIPSNLAAIKAGRLRALSVTGPKRSPALPDVPTIAEAGVGFDFVGWWGLFVPAGTPPAIVGVIHREAVKAINAPDVRDRLVRVGQEIVGSTPEEFAAKYKENLAQFARIVKEARVSLQD